MDNVQKHNNCTKNTSYILFYNIQVAGLNTDVFIEFFRLT
jgi:hypothetical protein